MSFSAASRCMASKILRMQPEPQLPLDVDKPFSTEMLGDNSGAGILTLGCGTGLKSERNDVWANASRTILDTSVGTFLSS